MNRLFFVISFVLIAGLSSCNKEVDQIPTPAKARAGATNALPPIVTQRRYQLIQRGSQVLTYESFSNRLSQVTSTAQYGGITYYNYSDTPGNRSIKTSRYLASRLMNKNIFQLADNGLCAQADYWSYTYDSDYSQTQPSDVFVVHKQYEYSNGRLSYTTTTAESATRGGSLQPFGEPRTDSFYYNTKGDLVFIYSYVNQKKTAEVLFGYGPSVGQPDADDKLPLNSSYVSENSYLPIFGPSSTHLVRSAEIKNFDGSTSSANVYKTTYDYVLNKEGYVVTMDLKRWDKFTLTEAYQYSPVPTFPF